MNSGSGTSSSHSKNPMLLDLDSFGNIRFFIQRPSYTYSLFCIVQLSFLELDVAFAITVVHSTKRIARNMP